MSAMSDTKLYLTSLTDTHTKITSFVGSYHVLYCYFHVGLDFASFASAAELDLDVLATVAAVTSVTVINV